MDTENGLSAYLSALQKKGTLTDFTFTCEDGNIGVHKAVIAAQSHLAHNILVEYNGGCWRPNSGNIELPWRASQIQDAVDILYERPFPNTKAANILTTLQILRYLQASNLEDKCLQKLEKFKGSEIIDLISASTETDTEVQKIVHQHLKKTTEGFLMQKISELKVLTKILKESENHDEERHLQMLLRYLEDNTTPQDEIIGLLKLIRWQFLPQEAIHKVAIPAIQAFIPQEKIHRLFTDYLNQEELLRKNAEFHRSKPRNFEDTGFITLSHDPNAERGNISNLCVYQADSMKLIAEATIQGYTGEYSYLFTVNDCLFIFSYNNSTTELLKYEATQRTFIHMFYIESLLEETTDTNMTKCILLDKVLYVITQKEFMAINMKDPNQKNYKIEPLDYPNEFHLWDPSIIAGDGKIFLVGGIHTEKCPTYSTVPECECCKRNTCISYHPLTATWTELPSLPFPIEQPVIERANGELYCFGSEEREKLEQDDNTCYTLKLTKSGWTMLSPHRNLKNLQIFAVAVSSESTIEIMTHNNKQNMVYNCSEDSWSHPVREGYQSFYENHIYMSTHPCSLTAIRNILTDEYGDGECDQDIGVEFGHLLGEF